MAEKKSEARPWGRWSVVAHGAGYKVKKLEVNPGHRLSLQKHSHRSEHWTVVAGKARVQYDGRCKTRGYNQSVFIRKGTWHRIHNPFSTRLVIIEVQCGSYLGEDDIVRQQDDYGRQVSSRLATPR